MVAAEDARGCTALHYACRSLARSERSASASVEDLNLIKEGAEEVTDCRGVCTVHMTYMKSIPTLRARGTRR